MKRRIAAFLISIFVIVSTCLGGVEFNVRADDTETYDIDVTYCQTQARSILDYVNELRTGDDAWYWNSDDETKTTCSNLSELEYDYELEKIAMQRAAEIAVYYSHTRPSGETTWSIYDDYAYSWTAVGENIAAGYTSASAVFTGWAEEDDDYSGQGHRRNMLGSSFTRIGIACVKYNGKYYWVMELAKSTMANNTTEALDEEKTVSVEIADSEISSIQKAASVSSYTLFAGDTAEIPVITATFSTTNIWPSSYTVTSTAAASWSSTNESCVTVSDSKITAVATGQAELTATAFGETFSVPVYVYSEPTFSWSSDYTTCTATFTCGSTSEKVDCTITKTSSTAATCTSAGYNVYKAECTFGGKTFSDSATEETAATGHTWNSGTVTTAATCTTTGVKTYTCTGCGTTKTETIAATGHTVVSFAKKAATTSSNGYTAGTKCSVCGEILSGKTTIYKIKSVTLKTTSYTYNGSAKKPGVVVKDSKGNTISSSNYTVTYKNNKNVGKATVTIKFKNNYSGTVTKTFKINPKGTSISSITKGKKAFTVKWKKQSTKMSTSRITGYQIQYSTSSSFSSSTTKTISGYGTTSKKITGLKSNKKYYVRIRTYRTVNGTKYYSSWSSVKTVKTK